MWIETDAEDPDQALPFVNVVVAGRAIRALLDTGAGRTTVEPSAGAILETRPAEGSGVFGGQGERHVWRTTVELGNRHIGPIDLDTRRADEGRDLIGQDVLAQFRCEYRFADAVVRLDGPMPVETHQVFLDRGRHIYLDVIWPDATASAVLDTGASVSVVDAAFAAAHPSMFSNDSSSQGTDASGTTLETPMVQMQGPHILGKAFASTTAAVVDLTRVNQSIERRMDLIIGWPILRQANWVIDHASCSGGLTE